jgi:tetratricopeptide (TPR) repeat protein
LTALAALMSLAASAGGVQSASTASVLEERAEVETEAGQYAAAIRDANAAAAMHETQGDVRSRGRALNQVGFAEIYSGDYRAATTALTTAVRLAAGAGDDEGRVSAITNLATVDFFLGRYADAAARYDAALLIADARRVDTWVRPWRRLLFGNKATLDLRLGRYQQALAWYREAQAASPDLRPRLQGQMLMNLGVLYRRLGDPIKALTEYDAAMALFSREHQLDSELAVMKNRGIVLALDLGQLEAARANFSEVLDRATRSNTPREMLQAHLYRGETELRMGLLDPAREDFASSLETARAIRTAEEEWKALYGLARTELQGSNVTAARTHLESAVHVIESIRETIGVPALKSDYFNDKRDVYDVLIGIELPVGDPQRLFALIERNHARAWRDRLGLGGEVTLHAVQHALPAGVVLLDTWSSPWGSAMVTVTRDRAQVTRIEVSEPAVRDLVDGLAAGPGGGWRRSATKLAAGVLPGGLPAGTRHAIVVPDGALSLLPFELLPIGGQLMIERTAVSYAPTAALLFRRPAVRRAASLPWTAEFRGFGDPHFVSASLDDTASLRMRLAGTAVEVRGIASELGGRSILHLGAGDQKVHLLDAAEEAPLLHLATHAVADTDAMERSRILFSPRNGGQSSADYLFLKEAYDLPLQHVELAVLSACDTERGQLLRGEGVRSFSRAFLASGARSTVTTLWRVPDAPTAAFMKAFYYELQRGEPRDAALQTAKLRFARSGTDLADPHYWAAFVLTGEGLRPVPTAMRWSSLALAAAAAIFLLIALAFLAGAIQERTRMHPAER